jgi:GT2 family glycosyltransferase
MKEKTELRPTLGERDGDVRANYPEKIELRIIDLLPDQSPSPRIGSKAREIAALRMNNDCPRISVVVPTRNRPGDLAQLLHTILDQTSLPFQVIIVDGSQKETARQVARSFRREFDATGCHLIYLVGGSDGTSPAKNLGARFAGGEAIFFLDDDILLDRQAILEISDFLRTNKSALGIQPWVIQEEMRDSGLAVRIWKHFAKIMMLSYTEPDRVRVRRSLEGVFPSIVTRVISAQRLHGCAMCYRREVFKTCSFDTNLKRWGYMDDLDFSYRIYCNHPNSLYVVPEAKVIHKRSPTSRLEGQVLANMQTIYRFYVFFKIQAGNSILNLPAFLWAQIGRLIFATSRFVIRKSCRDSWELIYLLQSYFLAFRNLPQITRGELEFFNDGLTQR